MFLLLKVVDWRLIPSYNNWLRRTGVFELRLPFCILIVLGDVLNDGDLHFLEAAKTLEAARKRIEALADLLPG